MEKIKFNLNEKVYAKLTPYGKSILSKQYGRDLPDWFEKYHVGDGYYSFQLHDLMHTFGNILYMGNTDVPFDLNIIIPISRKLG